MNEKIDLISVGEIINTQGHKGAVRVWPLTDFPERFRADDVILMDKDGQTSQLTIENVRSQKNFLVIKFREIPDMNEAEKLKGGILKVTKDQLTDLPPDTFFIFEIVGMEVYTKDGEFLGSVKDVIQAGNNDVYVVGGLTKEYLIPAVKQIVKKMDRESRQIMIDPPEGLLEL